MILPKIQLITLIVIPIIKITGDAGYIANIKKVDRALIIGEKALSIVVIKLDFASSIIWLLLDTLSSIIFLKK